MQLGSSEVSFRLRARRVPHVISVVSVRRCLLNLSEHFREQRDTFGFASEQKHAFALQEK